MSCATRTRNSALGPRPSDRSSRRRPQKVEQRGSAPEPRVAGGRERAREGFARRARLAQEQRGLDRPPPQEQRAIQQMRYPYAMATAVRSSRALVVAPPNTSAMPTASRAVQASGPPSFRGAAARAARASSSIAPTRPAENEAYEASATGARRPARGRPGVLQRRRPRGRAARRSVRRHMSAQVGAGLDRHGALDGGELRAVEQAGPHARRCRRSRRSMQLRAGGARARGSASGESRGTFCP